MNSILSKIITKIKGGNWELDPNLTSAELINLILKKGWMYIRGVLRFGRIKPVTLIGSNVIIIAKNKIKAKGVLSIERNSYIDATSSGGIVFGNNVSIGKNTTIECSGTLTNLGVGLIV